MSDNTTKETIEQALSGKDTPVEIDWSQYGDVEDLDPQEGLRSKRGRKPTGEVREHISSEFVASAEDMALLESDSSLHNASLPEHRIQQEKSDHRFLVYLFSQGKSVKEVFCALGGKWDTAEGGPLPTKQHGGRYSYAHLTQIRRQPWFQAQVVEIMKQEGLSSVSASFEVEFENSLQTIIEVRDDPNEKGSTRLAAANTFLDRFLGKPTQHVKSETTTKTITEIASDKAEVDRELEVIEAEIVAMNPEPVREL